MPADKFRRKRLRTYKGSATVEIQVTGADEHWVARTLELLTRVAEIQARELPDPVTGEKSPQPCGCSGS